MANTKIKSLNNIWKYFHTISLLLFSIINITSSEQIEDIYNETLFNNILKFNQKQYQINNFAKNENEDFIIQFSEDSNFNELSSSRLFYGLTNEGRYFFSNKSSYSKEFNINIDLETFLDNDFYWTNQIQYSKSLFVFILSDPHKEKKYLFSINSYNSMVELYDLNNGNNNYLIWSFHKFFNKSKKELNIL